MDVHLWCSCLPAGRGQPAARYMHAEGDRDPKRRRQREEKKLNTGGSEGQGSLLHTTPACIAYPSAGTWLSARPGGPVGIARSIGSDPAAGPGSQQACAYARGRTPVAVARGSSPGSPTSGSSARLATDRPGQLLSLAPILLGTGTRTVVAWKNLRRGGRDV